MIKKADELSKSSGVSITVTTVSLEPTSYGAGEFPINRSQWEEELSRLFDAYAPDRDTSWRDYGRDFENDIFWIHIDYQHFDCECGVGDFGSDEHKKPCPYWWTERPNFFHKPTGYGVKWYKYPCREAYGNQPKTIEEFRKIIDSCINSCKI